MPPEDNPADDQPIDREAYEAFMAEVAKQDSCPRCLDTAVDLCERCKSIFIRQVTELLNPAREAKSNHAAHVAAGKDGE